MPYKSGFIQAAVGAFCTLAFVISQQFGAPEPKQKRLSGVIEKTSDRTFALKDESGSRHEFVAADQITVFLNERTVPFETVQDGRRVTVQYTKAKKKLVANTVDVFPTFDDSNSIS